MEEFVIVTLRGWDGSRIIGVFSSMEMAMGARENFSKAHPQKGDTLKDEFIFDVVNLNQLSSGLEITAYSPSRNPENVVIRNHRYE